MSMEDPPVAGGGAGSGPEGVGEAAGGASEAAVGGETEAPTRQYVEVDDPDNRYVKVKVNGEDQEVPFAEAIRGYSREADYTRKAQEVAEARRQAEFGLQLQQALQNNPEMTLRILAENYGITMGQAQAMVEQQQPEPVFDDPLEQQIYQERQARLALEDRLAQRDADQELERAIGGLRNEFNLKDEDIQMVVQQAFQMKADPSAFPAIWKAIAYDRIAARVRAQQDSAAANQAQQQQRQDAAAAATALIGNSTGAGNGLTNQVDPSSRHMTIREAAELALNQHGV